MKRSWDEQELYEHWTLTPEECVPLAKGRARNKLGYAVLLKFFQLEGRFPYDHREVPDRALNYLAEQVGAPSKIFLAYDWANRTGKSHRNQIRSHLGFRKTSADDVQTIVAWLCQDVLPTAHEWQHLPDAVLDWCRDHRLEPPVLTRIERLTRSAVHIYETSFFQATYNQISSLTRSSIDDLLDSDSDSDSTSPSSTNADMITTFSALKADPGRSSLDSVLKECAKFRRIKELDLPDSLFSTVSPKVVRQYRLRAASEKVRELRMHPEPIRYSLVAAFCRQRRQEILDGLVELLMQIVHRISIRAEKRVVNILLQDLRRVSGKTTLLYRLAEAALHNPDGVIKDVLYPLVGEQTLLDLVKEYKATGPAYQRQVHTVMRASYGHHYRRMLPHLLDTLDFRSNNVLHRPVIDAISFLKAHRSSRQRYFSLNDGVPIEGVIRSGWQSLVLEQDPNGDDRVNCINYEIAVLQALRERLRCKEIWVAGADHYRNPDEDLPVDFGIKRTHYYQALKQPLDAETFISSLQQSMVEALSCLDQGLPHNDRVHILTQGKKRIKLSPLEAQPEPPYLSHLKTEVTKRWPMTSLLDVVKEADLRVGFTEAFTSMAQREFIDPANLRKRLLLCLYGLGTNTGLKRIAGGNHGIGYEEMLYVRRRFITKEHLRQAIAHVANAIFRIRQSHIWGDGTTACASDGKKFGAWDQNLMTEWHIRYGGRGVMIYWHVEPNSTCIYSQLKRCSSSEVAAMIEGVLRHCTDMTVEKNYVDSHGQSEVAFAFCHLLGFELLPRLKNLSSQKLYLPTTGYSDYLSNLQPILTRPIIWDRIHRQYDEMIKYTTGLRLGTADSEAILRRFTRDNLKHPTYQALIELGKVKRTIFLCNYLHREELPREVHNGLNVLENWNSTNGFIFYGKGGEVATNRLDDQEVAVLALHLVQICLVYVNTLMIQQVLAEPQWLGRMTPEDFRALTPLIYSHVNPYGTFSLDMATIVIRLENLSLNGLF